MKIGKKVLQVGGAILLTLLGAWFIFGAGTVQAPPDTGEQSLSGTPAPTIAAMQPNYGELTAAQIAIADSAIGKLLNAGYGLSPGNITVLTVQEQSFGDSSLGCPEPGMSYTQVVTSGYIVLLQAGGQQYEYHTDHSGETVVACPQ